MKLFVDDSRDFPKAEYECCRDADTAIMLLSLMPFEKISLDYSLGQGEKTGLSILKWMKENNVFVPEIVIHSNHIEGRRKMLEYCEENFPESKVTLRMLRK